MCAQFAKQPSPMSFTLLFGEQQASAKCCYLVKCRSTPFLHAKGHAFSFLLFLQMWLPTPKGQCASLAGRSVVRFTLFDELCFYFSDRCKSAHAHFFHFFFFFFFFDTGASQFLNLDELPWSNVRTRHSTQCCQCFVRVHLLMKGAPNCYSKCLWGETWF